MSNHRYTRYAENKFDVLNRHKIFFTKEQIADALKLPDQSGRKGPYYYVRKDNLKIIYKKEERLIKILTFFPV